MSGVRNLRAMFEQKHEPGNSPPSDRGRSPGPGLASFPGSPTPSSRPLSKVRTNFVAIEKDGRIGLQRQPSVDSVSVSSRRFSNETENTTPAPVLDNNDPFVENNMAMNATSFKTNLASEPIPESPSQRSPTKASPAKLSPTRGNQTPDITPCPNPDKIVDEEETYTKLTSADPTVQRAPNGTSNGMKSTPDPKAKVKNTASPNKTATKTTAPISTSAKATSKALKSPLTVKQPKSPSKETTKAPEKKPASAATRSSVVKPSTSKPTASTASTAQKPSGLNLSPSTGFVKPKPKSPTHPVKLPASLTAPTNASSSKLGSSAPPPRRSLSRPSGNLGVPAPAQRSTSRASASTVPAPPAGKTLRRQASTINRSRSSIGPPPSQPAKEHPPTRKEVNVDEGFLARMMRPTQSSSSKTLDKTPVTPPRKQAAASTIKKTSHHGEGSAQKAAAKMTESIKNDSNVKRPAVVKTEIKKANSARVAKPAAPTANEVAPVVAQTESRKTAVQAAKTSGDTAVVPPAEKQETNGEEKTETAARSTTPESEPPTCTEEETGPEPPAQTSQPEVAAEVDVPEVGGSLVTEEPKTEGSEVASESKVSETPKIEEPVVAGEPETINESELDDGNEASLAIVESVIASPEEAHAEEIPDVKEHEIISADESVVPAITADPEKVEDIEDLVQGTEKLSLDKSS